MDLLNFDNDMKNEPEYVASSKTVLSETLLKVPNVPQQTFYKPQVEIPKEPENTKPVEVNKKPTLLDDASEIINMNNLMEIAPKDTKTLTTKLYDDFDDEWAD